MPKKKKILLLSDNVNCSVAGDLDILYPNRVEKLNFTSEAHDVKVLKRYGYVITMVHSGEYLPALDYEAVTEYARRGGQVISCLFEYTQSRGLHFSKTYVGDRLRPAMRIEVENDVTRGYAAGDIVWWYGTVSGAADMRYSNQMLQRQILDVSESENVRVLATSNINGGAVMIQEKVGKGRILALDLLSPKRPFFNSHGSTNKYLFPGNFIGGTVHYGKHYAKKLSYDEFVAAMHQTGEHYPELRVEPEGLSSDGRLMWTFGIGDERKPTIYFGAALHGWEWENAYGLLRLAELLSEDPKIEGLDTRQYHFKIVPIQNPYGYDHFVRQNAHGVDLNRNFDCAWEELPVVQDAGVPWDYNCKGTRPASEPETQVIQQIIARYAPRCLIDFHTADYIMDMTPGGDYQVLRAIHREIRRRLKDRYLCQRPYGGPYQQVNMERIGKAAESLPYLVHYAASQGVPAAFLIEMSGDRDDTHALVMNTDTVVEICLGTIKQCLKRDK